MSDNDSSTPAGTDGTSNASDSTRDETFASASSTPAEDGGQPAEMDGPALADPAVALIQAKDLQLNDAGSGEPALEPQLGTEPDTVELIEPTLEPVRISDDAADATELAAVAAEARRVEAEAEEARRLAGGQPPPRKGATATAATSTADQRAVTEDIATPAAAAERARQPNPTTPAQTPPNTVGSPSAPTNYKPLLWIGLAVLLALVLIVVIVFSLLGNARASASEAPQNAQSMGTPAYPDLVERPVRVNG